MSGEDQGAKSSKEAAEAAITCLFRFIEGAEHSSYAKADAERFVRVLSARLQELETGFALIDQRYDKLADINQELRERVAELQRQAAKWTCIICGNTVWVDETDTIRCDHCEEIRK